MKFKQLKKQKQREQQKNATVAARAAARSPNKPKGKTAQQSIPFVAMRPDGVCNLGGGYFSKSIAFQDVNYQISRQDDRMATFERWCDLLNYFDSSMLVQITLQNEFLNAVEFNAQIMLKEQKDDYDVYRRELNEMLQSHVTHGKNSIRKTKQITFAVKADNEELGVQSLNRIELDVHNNLKEIGCRAETQDGYARLQCLYDLYRKGTQESFNFQWEWIHKTGMRAVDFICPSAFDFRPNKHFRMGDMYCTTSFVRITAPELSDEFLTELCELQGNMTVTISLQSVQQDVAIKRVKRQLATMEANKVEAQKRAIKGGYDMDMIPAELKKYISEAENMLESLQTRNQRMFMVSIVILNMAEDMETLNSDLFAIKSVAQKYNCSIEQLDEQQEAGLNSVVPLGLNQLFLRRTLDTTAAAVYIPFTTQELFERGGMYYGANALSGNLVLLNRRGLSNPSGFILGSPGSGKSFAAKREMVNVLLNTNDDVFVIDPEREYAPLAQGFGGELIHIAAGSPAHINPFDLSLDYSDDNDPLSLKADFVLSMCELLAGGREGLSPIQISIVDRCVQRVYSRYLSNPQKHDVPTLKDFLSVVREQPEEAAKDLAGALEIYAEGSLGVFANRTNIDVNNRFIVYDIKDLGKNLKTLGLLIVLDQIWNRLTTNRKEGKRTWIYIDEIYLLFANEYSANFLFELYKRARKWGGIPTGITQNVEDLLRSDLARSMLSNSGFIMMMNQAATDRNELARLLNISKQQLGYVTNAGPGQGLLFAGSSIIPFIDKFPKDTRLYAQMTTKVDEVAQLQKQHLRD